MKIFDSHIHVGTDIPVSRQIKDIPSLLNIMQDEGIDGAVVIPTFPSFEENFSLINECNHSPFAKSKLYPFFWYQDELMLEDLEDRQDEIFGLKYHPSITQIPLSLWFDCHKMAIKVCKHLQIPLLVHCGRDVISSPHFVFSMAQAIPEVNFILAHFGGMVVDKIEHAIKYFEILKCPENVYFDLANGRHPWLLRDFVNRFGSRQLLFGTDMPFVDFKLTLMNIKRAGLKPEDEENILWNNAQRVICKLGMGR